MVASLYRLRLGTKVLVTTRLFEPRSRRLITSIAFAAFGSLHMPKSVGGPASAVEPDANYDHVILRALRATFDSGITLPLERRLKQLTALRNVVAAWKEKIVAAVALDMGRPEFETTNIELAPLDGDIAIIQRDLPSFVRPEDVSTPLTLFPATTTRTPQPKGVVLILAPWNFPVRLSLLPLAAALAAGNVALVKPSEKAPNCAALVRDLIHTFLDAEAIAVVEGDGKVAASLLEHKFDHIFYTGSESAGRQVYAAAARHLTPVTLELGGKNACYVHSDVDIEVTARRLLHGALVNCGQMCLGLDLAYVTRACCDLNRRLKDNTQGMVRRQSARVEVTRPASHLAAHVAAPAYVGVIRW